MPKVTEHDPGDRRLHRAARRARLRVRRSRATSTSASRSFPEYGRLSGQRPDQVEEQEPNALKEDPRDFALWKANKPGEDTALGLAVGAGPAGLAHRVLGDGRGARSARRSRSTAAGSTSSSRTTRTSSRSRARSATRSRAIWAHNGMLRFTGEKMSKSVGNIATIREALDEWGREALLVFFLGGHWRKPIDFSEETMAQAAAQAERLPQRLPRPPSEPERRLGARSPQRSRTTSTRPRRSRVMHELARRTSLLRRALDVFGLELARRADEAAAGRSSSSPSARPRRAPTRDFERADRLRAEIEAAGWEMRDEPGGYTLVREAVTRRPRLRPARRARGAARPARGARAAGDRARASTAEPWLAEATARRSSPSAS